MNKNTLIGFVLIGAIMIGFGWYNSKQIEKQQHYQAQQDSIARANAPQPIISQIETLVAQAANDAQQREIEIENLGEQLASALVGDEQFYTIENNLLTATFSNKGGRIYSVLLKNFQSYEKEPIVLFSGDENYFALEFFTKQRVSTGDFYFAPLSIPTIAVINDNDTTAKHITLRLSVDSASWIDYTYTLRHDSYMFDLSIKMVGMNKHIPQNVNSMDLTWEVDLKTQKKGHIPRNCVKI
jgi:YidC/Oxa1 family membrane protein insertase